REVEHPHVDLEGVDGAEVSLELSRLRAAANLAHAPECVDVLSRPRTGILVKPAANVGLDERRGGPDGGARPPAPDPNGRPRRLPRRRLRHANGDEPRFTPDDALVAVDRDRDRVPPRSPGFPREPTARLGGNRSPVDAPPVRDAGARG